MVACEKQVAQSRHPKGYSSGMSKRGTERNEVVKCSIVARTQGIYAVDLKHWRAKLSIAPMVGVCARILANELELICVHVHIAPYTRRCAWHTLHYRCHRRLGTGDSIELTVFALQLHAESTKEPLHRWNVYSSQPPVPIFIHRSRWWRVCALKKCRAHRERF